MSVLAAELLSPGRTILLGFALVLSTVALSRVDEDWEAGNRRRIRLGFKPIQDPESDAAFVHKAMAAAGVVVIIVGMIRTIASRLPLDTACENHESRTHDAWVTEPDDASTRFARLKQHRNGRSTSRVLAPVITDLACRH